MLLLFARPLPAENIFTPEKTIYYVRLDIKYVNGVVGTGRLTMVPWEPDFRAAGFTLYRASGRSSGAPKKKLKALARHNAVENLLLAHGLKSVHSKETVIDSVSSAEMVISYEGAVKHPFQIIREGYLKDQKSYGVEADIEFSPLAFPDKWRTLLLKKKITLFFSDLIQYFKR